VQFHNLEHHVYKKNASSEKYNTFQANSFTTSRTVDRPATLMMFSTKNSDLRFKHWFDVNAHSSMQALHPMMLRQHSDSIDSLMMSVKAWRICIKIVINIFCCLHFSMLRYTGVYADCKTKIFKKYCSLIL